MRGERTPKDAYQNVVGPVPRAPASKGCTFTLCKGTLVRISSDLDSPQSVHMLQIAFELSDHDVIHIS